MTEARRNPMFWPLVVILAIGAVYFVVQFFAPALQPDPTVAPTTMLLATNTTSPTRVTEVSRTSSPTETFTPTLEANFYINSFTPVAAHDCPNTDCAVLVEFPMGARLDVVEVLADGESIGGDTIWYRVRVDDGDVFVHRSFVALLHPTAGTSPTATIVRPTRTLTETATVAYDPAGTATAKAGGSFSTQPIQQPQIIVTLPPAPPTWTQRPPNTPVRIPTQRPSSFTCPQNCDGARAMGLSAQQAASCGLDRDGDGVACYGD